MEALPPCIYILCYSCDEMLPFPCLLSPSCLCTCCSHCPSVHLRNIYSPFRGPLLSEVLLDQPFSPHCVPQTEQQSSFTAVLSLCNNYTVSCGGAALRDCEGSSGRAGLLPQGPHKLNGQVMAGAVGHLSHQGTPGYFQLWRARCQV